MKGGYTIPVPVKGGRMTMLSAKYAGLVVRYLNSMTSLKVQRGARDGFEFSDSNAILTIARDATGSASTGSEVTVYKVTSIANLSSNYIAAKPVAYDDSNAETLGAEVNVALPWPLRDAQVTARVPEYAVDDYIVVSSTADGAGVVVSGAQLTLTDFGIGRIDDPSSYGAERFRIKSVQGDYMTCRTWDGTTEGGTDIYIAKPPKLRHSITSESIEGVTVSYSYGARANNNDGYRTASAGGVSVTEVVLPVYICDAINGYDEIFATKPLRGTDVMVSTVECEYLDLNVDWRLWSMIA